MYENRIEYIDRAADEAERNVLPVLNNLLENREMQLEDGRFLVAPMRYDRLKREGTDLQRLNLATRLW